MLCVSCGVEVMRVEGGGLGWAVVWWGGAGGVCAVSREEGGGHLTASWDKAAALPGAKGAFDSVAAVLVGRKVVVQHPLLAETRRCPRSL